LAFYRRADAEEHAKRSNGDVRRPRELETFEDLKTRLQRSANIMMAPRQGPGSRVITMDHPLYSRPLSATGDFTVAGRPISVVIVARADCGCVEGIFAAHSGAGAADRADAEVKARRKANDEDESEGGYTFFAKQIDLR